MKRKKRCCSEKGQTHIQKAHNQISPAMGFIMYLIKNTNETKLSVRYSKRRHEAQGVDYLHQAYVNGRGEAAHAHRRK